MSEAEFENTITKAFVNFLNKEKNTNYQFDSRPDELERHRPAPDFKFVDSAVDCILFIELSRITVMDLDSYNKIKRIFSYVKQKLNGSITGSFLLTMDSENLKLPEKTKERIKYLNIIIEKIKETFSKMSVNYYTDEITDGMRLRKFDDTGSKVLIEPIPIYTFIHNRRGYVINLLNETSEKFRCYDTESCNNILIFLDTSPLWYEFITLIKSLESNVYGDNVDFTYLGEIYKIEFDTDWNKYIGITECYPGSRTQNWCLPSQLFDDQKEYRDVFFRYFMGAR